MPAWIDVITEAVTLFFFTKSYFDMKPEMKMRNEIIKNFCFPPGIRQG